MSKNSGIQGLRAIAASLVVYQHAVYFACVAKGVGFTQYLPIGFGQMGVGIFFVISGFVMTLCLPQGKMFMVQRVGRIYPSYWAAVILSGLVLPLIGRGWSIDAYSLTLLPASSFNETYAVPYWTLVYEIVFYAVIYACILLKLSRKSIAVTLSLWAVVIMLACQSEVHPAFESDIGAMLAGKWILLSPANLMFIGGALYGLVGKEAFGKAGTATVAFQAGILFFLAQASIPMPYYLRYLLWGASFTQVLHLVQQVRMPRFVERAGDYSYGLYLIHTIVIALLMWVMARFAPTAPLAAYFTVAFAGAFLWGMSFGAMEFLFHATVVKNALRRVTFLASRKLPNP